MYQFVGTLGKLLKREKRNNNKINHINYNKYLYMYIYIKGLLDSFVPVQLLGHR